MTGSLLGRRPIAPFVAACLLLASCADAPSPRASPTFQGRPVSPPALPARPSPLPSSVYANLPPCEYPDKLPTPMAENIAARLPISFLRSNILEVICNPLFFMLSISKFLR